jgi:hypothetical protein
MKKFFAFASIIALASCGTGETSVSVETEADSLQVEVAAEIDSMETEATAEVDSVVVTEVDSL